MNPNVLSNGMLLWGKEPFLLDLWIFLHLDSLGFGVARMNRSHCLGPGEMAQRGRHLLGKWRPEPESQQLYKKSGASFIPDLGRQRREDPWARCQPA